MSASPTLDHAPTLAPGKRSALRRRSGALYRTLVRAFPHNRFGDRLFSLVEFIKFHGRLPSGAGRYNDVLYRIKTTDEILDPLRVFVSDKEFVKLYIKAMVGDEYNVPTIDIIRSAAALDTYVFPATCVVKPTHASGRIVFRRNGEPLDIEELKSWFSFNYYRINREANYKLLEPKIIVEPLVFGSSNVEDYKIFCVRGQPRMIQVDVDRHTVHKRKYFDAEWRELDFSIKYPRAEKGVARPENLSEMLSIAAELSKHFWFVRVDLYSNGSKALVGELTHCADGAGGKFIPAAAEELASKELFR